MNDNRSPEVLDEIRLRAMALRLLPQRPEHVTLSETEARGEKLAEVFGRVVARLEKLGVKSKTDRTTTGRHVNEGRPYARPSLRANLPSTERDSRGDGSQRVVLIFEAPGGVVLGITDSYGAGQDGLKRVEGVAFDALAELWVGPYVEAEVRFEPAEERILRVVLEALAAMEAPGA